MGYLNPTQRAELQARLVTLQAQLVLLDETYEKAIASDIEEYKLDTGEAMQQVRKRRLKSIREEIEYVQASIDLIYRKLTGSGIVNLTLRRKSSGGRCY